MKKVTAVIKLQCKGGEATPAPPIGPALLEGAYTVLRSQFDDDWGGFGPPPKFPQFSETLVSSLSMSGGDTTCSHTSPRSSAMDEMRKRSIAPDLVASLVEGWRMAGLPIVTSPNS